MTAISTQPRQSGFSIIELMVALLLFSVLLNGLVELFISTKKNSNATEKLMSIQENGRIALQLLSSDIRRAGFFGGYVGGVSIEGSSGAAATSSAGSCINSTVWGRLIDEPVFGLNDSSNGYACLSSSEHLRGDVLTVRYASSWPATTTDMANASDRLYLRSSVNEARIFAGEDQAATANTVTDTEAEVYPLIAHSYYVGPSVRTCQGAAIPALFRKALSSSGLPVSQELLAGVEHLQFRYREGTRYRDADTVGNWSDVSAVEITVLVRAECREGGFTNERTFAMGDLASDYGPSDGYRRQVYTTVAAIRNSGGM